MPIIDIFLLVLFLLFAVFVLLLGVVLALGLFGNVIADAPFVPVPQRVALRVSERVKNSTGGIFYDLGSGDGRVTFSVARANSSVHAIGVEMAPLPYMLARVVTIFSRYSNVHFVQKNFHHVPLYDASVIFVYLFPEVMEKLKQKFLRELKPGTLIISCDFLFKDWVPMSSEKIFCTEKTYTLYTYVM